jgi:VWFA-related protein
LLAPAALAQQSGPPAEPSKSRVYLDVVVSHKSDPPLSGLQQRDFTVVDNKTPQTITSFEAIQGKEAHVDVVVVIDAVNAGYNTVAYERDQIDHFLKADRGDLLHATSLFVLTDTGIEPVEDFSNDGDKLSTSLDRYTVGLRFVERNDGFYGAAERLQISLKGLHDLIQRVAARPGRKMIICVSPGWPFLSGPQVLIDSKEQQELFGEAVGFSTDLLRGRITLYSVDPFGAQADPDRLAYWDEFLKGVSKPSQALPGNLGLQVLAMQSGGLSLYATNDIAGLLQTCLADTRAYYELSIEAPVDGAPDQYHRLEIRIAEPGMKARTRQGYYSRPDLEWQPLTTPLKAGGLEEP